MVPYLRLSLGRLGTFHQSPLVPTENTCPRLEPKVPSQKRSGQSWAVSSCRPDKRSNELDEKRRARPFSSSEIGREKHGSSHRRGRSGL